MGGGLTERHEKQANIQKNTPKSKKLVTSIISSFLATSAFPVT
jgi:hypothetical protein